MTTTKKAIFMMGGPASGKSTVLAKMFPGILTIDSDAIKAEHPDFDINDPSALHAWSSNEATRRFFAAISSGEAVVFDGTGSTAEKYVRFINAARELGYETTLVYVKTSLTEALARNAKRARTVPEEIVREKFSNIATSFDIVSGYADHIEVVRN